MDILKENEFEKAIKEHPLVLVDFFANWCMPCRMLAPIMENVKEHLKNVYVCKVDIDQAEELSRKLKIFSIPTLLLFKNGQAVESIVGLQNFDTIVGTVKKHI